MWRVEEWRGVDGFGGKRDGRMRRVIEGLGKREGWMMEGGGDEIEGYRNGMCWKMGS